MDSFYIATSVFIVLCHVVTGCGPSGGPSGGPPGSDGTYGKAPPDNDIFRADDLGPSRTGVIARRAIQDYQERPTPKVMFRVFDEDKNGNIDACEWMEAGMTTNVRDFVRILDEVDENKDNVISVHEFEALHVRWKYGEIDAGTSSDEDD